MAKRKADELVDEEGSQAVTKCTKTEIHEGSGILRSIFREWKKKSSHKAHKTTRQQ